MLRECDLSIITINFNGIADTCKLIESIPNEDLSIEVIVVDNASSNDEASEIKRRYPSVRLARSKENLGFAGGNNLGYRHSRGKYIFFVNNDTEFDGSSLAPLIKRIESSEKIAMVCPKIVFFDAPRHLQFAGYTPLSSITLRNRAIGFGEEDKGQYDEAHSSPYAHGAAMMVKREAIERVGEMPECYFLYYEELDWSMMMRRAGYDIWYEPLTTIYHKESRSTGQNSPLRTYYIARNRLLLAKRNGKGLARWLSYAYIICATIVKDFIANLVKGKPATARAAMEGISDFLVGRTGKKLVGMTGKKE